jgi:hypothetical protein
MRAPMAFLNGAGSRRKLKFGRTNRGALRLTDLLFYTGVTLQPAPTRSGAHRVHSNRGSRRQGP